MTRQANYLFWFLLIAMFTLGVPTESQAQTVSTGFLAKKVNVGEQTYFVLKITNGLPGNDIPSEINVPGLTIQFSNSRRSASISSAGQEIETTYLYLVTGNKEGEFTIPAMSFTVNNVLMTTKPATLKVGTPTPEEKAEAVIASRPHFLKLISEKTSVYPNELFPLQLEIYVRTPKMITEVGMINLEDERFVFRRFQLDEKRQSEEIAGYQFSKILLNGSGFALSSAEPGKMSIGPAEMKVKIEGSSRFPGFRFGGFGERTNESLQSETLEIELKPFPAAGKPANFTGTVGSFQLTGKPSITELTVGDPISMDFEVTGPGNYGTLDELYFRPKEDSNWKTYEARKIVDPAEDSDGVKPGRATFTQIIIPQTELTEIPSFEIVAFNPEIEKYEVLRTPPIPIIVKPDPSAVTGAASPALTLGGGNFGANPLDAAKPAARFDEILSVKPGLATWRSAPVALAQQPIFWIAQAIPSVALFTLIGLAVARTGKRRRLKRSRKSELPSFAEVRKLVDTSVSQRGEFYRQVSDALEAWERDSKKSVDELEESQRVAFRALESRCEWILYGAAKDDREDSPAPQEVSEARQILDSLPK